MTELKNALAQALGLDEKYWEPPLTVYDPETLRLAAAEDAANWVREAESGNVAELSRVGTRVREFANTAPNEAVEAMIDRAAPAVSPLQRDLLRLRQGSKLSYKQIADRMGMKPKNVAKEHITMLCIANRAIDSE